MRPKGSRILLGLGALLAVLTVVSGAGAAGFHGIAFSKGCTGSTPVFQPYTCQYQILNVADTAQDTLLVSSIVDHVFAASGTQTSTNILHDGQLVFSGPTVTCVGGSGLGTPGSPYINATACSLPTGTNITVLPFSFYTVQPADYGLPGHVLGDQADLTWLDLCDKDTPPINCPVGNQNAQSGSQTIVTQLGSQTATQIHNAAHAVVTTVAAGTTVHDFVTVTGQPGSPAPTGNVMIDWFLNGTCTGAPAVNSGNIALGAGGTVDATAFSFAVNSAGQRAFRAHYLGSGAYTPSDGPCEPLTVVDANIQINPPTATNAVGTNHTLTAHVNVNAGGGFVNAPDGTVINFTLQNSGGATAVFVGPNSCTTAGGTRSCTVVISSPTVGTTTVKATTTVSVGGVALTRATGDGLAGDSADASKAWVNANIQITPATADNPVATTHVLTITVNAINGTLAAGTATASIVSGPGSFVGSPTCNYTGGGASASCTVTITSLVAGTTEVSATSNISVNGQSITRTTNTAVNTAAGGSGNALKNWTSLGSGRVTGGGSIFATINGVPNVRVTHGFELRCDPTDKRQSLEINWDGGNNFHLDKIINSVICFDDPTTQPPPPPGTAIDTYAGNTLFNGSAGYHGFGYAVGTGTCNKQPATIYFILIDAGEPGTADTAEYHIVSSGCTLNAGPAQLLKGNHQFHKN